MFEKDFTRRSTIFSAANQKLAILIPFLLMVVIGWNVKAMLFGFGEVIVYRDSIGYFIPEDTLSTPFDRTTIKQKSKD